MIAYAGLEPKQYHVTSEGIGELRELFASLQSARARLADEMESAFSQTGSGSALDDSVQVFNHGWARELDEQISLLRQIIVRAKIIAKPLTNEIVQLGSLVAVAIDGVKQLYSLVGPLEVDPVKGKISNESPLGRSLLGKRAG